MTNLNVKIQNAEIADYCECEAGSPTVIVTTSDDENNSFEWAIQTNECKFDTQAGCIAYVNGEEYCEDDSKEANQHFEVAVEYAEIFAAQSEIDAKQEDIINSKNFSEIEEVARKIKLILLSDKDTSYFLILASVIVNSESICINDTMIILQVMYGATQSQSSDIVALF